MRLDLSVGAVLALSIIAATSPQLRAELPADRTVTYLVYSDDSPNALLEWTIDIRVVAESSTETQVQWLIDNVKFTDHRPGTSGREWRDTDPNVDTPDGFWWVDHADCLKPENGDFWLPPYIADTATALGTGYGNLGYEFEGTSPSQPGEGEPANLAMVLTLQYDPPFEIEDEPVIVHGGQDPL